MTRLSTNEYHQGRVWNGFDYALQVWVLEGVIQPCEHPDTMRAAGRPCCAALPLAGRPITEVDGAESGPPPDPAAEIRDPLARILARHGFIRAGELEALPDRLPVVIKLGSGHRASTTAGQAPAFLALLGLEVAEVFVPVDSLQALRANPEALGRPLSKTEEKPRIPTTPCSCRFADPWRCAKFYRMTTITCTCSCHRQKLRK